MYKNIMKMFIISVIFVALAYNTTVFAGYEDISDHWAKETIEKFEEKSFLNSGDNTFKPDEQITKGELALIVNRYFDYGFMDSFEDNIKLAEEKGYLSNAKVEQNITREEVSILICKLLSLDVIEGEESTFMDSNQISIWAKGYISRLEKDQILIGYPDMTFKPQNNITKAEFVTVLNRCTGIGGNDLELVDTDVSKIEIGIIEFEDDRTSINPIEEVISMNSGDEITIALMLPEGLEEDEIIIDIENDEIIAFDREMMTIVALKEGKTKILFESKDEEDEVQFEVRVIE